MNSATLVWMRLFCISTTGNIPGGRAMVALCKLLDGLPCGWTPARRGEAVQAASTSCLAGLFMPPKVELCCCSIRIPLAVLEPFILRECSWKLWSMRRASILTFRFRSYYVSPQLSCYTFNSRGAIPHRRGWLFPPLCRLTNVQKSPPSSHFTVISYSLCTYSGFLLWNGVLFFFLLIFFFESLLTLHFFLPASSSENICCCSHS